MKSHPGFMLPALLALVVSPLQAVDDPAVLLARVRQYQQTSTSAPVLGTDSPYFFFSDAKQLPRGKFHNIQLRLPNTGRFETEPSYDGDSVDHAEFEGHYTDLAAFNSTFPTGPYKVVFEQDSGDDLTLNLSVASLNFPAAPQVKNYTACQSIAVGSDFVVQWNAWAGPATKDRVLFRVTDQESDYDFVSSPEPETDGALAGSTASYTIKAKALPPGKNLVGQVIFFRGDARGKTSWNLRYTSGAATITRFKLHTAGAADTTAPTVSSSVPASGATGVLSTATVTITFKEPMRTDGWSVNYENGSFNSPVIAWTSATKLTIKPPPGGWPKNTRSGIILNPAEQEKSIRDLSGNPLATKTIRFTVGGS